MICAPQRKTTIGLAVVLCYESRGDTDLVTYRIHPAAAPSPCSEPQLGFLLNPEA